MAAQEYYQSFAPQQQQQPYRRSSFANSQPSSFTQGFVPQNGPYNTQIAPYMPQPPRPYASSPAPPYPDGNAQYPTTQQPQAQSYMPHYQPYQQPQQQQQLRRPSQQNPQYLGAPLAPQRSYSSPPDPRHVRFNEDDSRGRRRDSKSSAYYSDYSTSPSRSRSRSRSRSKSRRRRQHQHKTQHRRQSDRNERTRDTFFGAGGGAIIGDAIFPGAGTLGGLILGGLGGRSYARHRSHSDLNRGRHKDYDHDYDEDKHRNGITVKRGLIRR